MTVTLNGVKATEDWLKKMTFNAERRSALHERWATIAWRWIGRNFASNGGMVGGWKPLAAGTLAARRGGSGNILQDRGAGGLKGSFMPEWTSEYAKVGSPLTIAAYHEYGTGTYGVRGAPYPIVPKKPGGVLAFEVAAGGVGVKKIRMKSGRQISLPYACLLYTSPSPRDCS